MHSHLSEIYYKLVPVPDSLKLDHGICDNVKSVVTASKAELHELKRGHQEKTKGISRNAYKSLGDDYKVLIFSFIWYIWPMMFPSNCLSFIYGLHQMDEPTCSTPRRREIDIPSRQSIGHLATPALEDLVKAFWNNRTPPTLAKGNGKSIQETQRAPLAIVN